MGNLIDYILYESIERNLKKLKVWNLVTSSKRCFKAAMKTKLSYLIQANNYVLLNTDTIGVPVKEINNNTNRVKSERESYKRIRRTH